MSRSFHPRMVSLWASFGCLLAPNSHRTNQIANSKRGQNIQPSKSLFRLRSAQKAKHTLGPCAPACRLNRLCEASLAVSVAIPYHSDFHLEVKTLYRKNIKTRAYAIMVELGQRTDVLSLALQKAFPPSLEMFFIPNEEWNSLSSRVKMSHITSHAQYRADTRALLFKGILDSTAIL